MRYYYKKGNRVSGPFDLERLRDCLNRGSIDGMTEVCAAIGDDGSPTETWGPMQSILPELFRMPEASSTDAGPSRPPSSLVLLCAGVMIIAFFMPWVQFFGLGASGYALSKFASEGKFAWLIPIVAGITVLVSINGKDNRPIGIVAGVLPLVAALFGVMRLMEETGTAASRQILEIGSNALGIGVWLTLAASIGIIVAASAPDSAVTATKARLDEKVRETLKPILAEVAPSPEAPKRFVISEEVTRLAELHAKGILTVEEFQTAKARMLVQL